MPGWGQTQGCVSPNPDAQWWLLSGGSGEREREARPMSACWVTPGDEEAQGAC